MTINQRFVHNTRGYVATIKGYTEGIVIYDATENGEFIQRNFTTTRAFFEANYSSR